MRRVFKCRGRPLALPRQGAWRAAILGVFVAFCFGALPPAHALSPLTPQLTDASRQDLLSKLAQAGLPQAGHNSVVLALAGVLGFEAADNTFAAHQAYPQLPQVEARSTTAGAAAGCAKVDLVARFAEPAAPRRVRVRGIYCLVGPARWEARTQTLD